GDTTIRVNVVTDILPRKSYRAGYVPREKEYDVVPFMDADVESDRIILDKWRDYFISRDVPFICQEVERIGRDGEATRGFRLLVERAARLRAQLAYSKRTKKGNSYEKPCHSYRQPRRRS
ncbi:MAG: hypothetical protein SCH71_16985, partial [Desulfobulbaceae bacterium]|nr:hypothetical protein [Desulfobulbaceae bacterium]